MRVLGGTLLVSCALAAGLALLLVRGGAPALGDLPAMARNLVLVAALLAMLAVYMMALRRLGWRGHADTGGFLGGSTLLWLAPMLALVNGALPYAGFQTDTVFTMFSNLRVEDGRRNHFLVPSSAQVADYERGLVRVTEAKGETWGKVLDDGDLLTWFEFERLLAQGDDFEVTCECYGTTLTITKHDGELTGFDEQASYTPVLGKLMRFRPVSDSGRMECTP